MTSQAPVKRQQPMAFAAALRTKIANTLKCQAQDITVFSVAAVGEILCTRKFANSFWTMLLHRSKQRPLSLRNRLPKKRCNPLLKRQ